MKLYYPMVFCKEGDGGFSVYSPDIRGCNTQGDTMEEAVSMAQEAIGICLEDIIRNGEAFPKASAPGDIETEKNESVVFVEFDPAAYMQKHDTRAVKKTLTIPAWINTAAERAGINFSATLQKAIKAELRL